MKAPSDKAIRWLTAELAMRALERYQGDTPELKVAAGDWFLDADEFDKRELVVRIKTELGRFIQATANRSARMIADGEMEEVEG